MTEINLTEGDDIYEAVAGDTVINGLGGDDMLFSSLGNMVLNGGDGDDTLVVTGDSNTLNGGTGFNIFDVTGDFNVIDGSEGQGSEITIAGDNNTVNLGMGSITIAGAFNILTSAAGAGTLYVTGDSNQLQFAGNIEVMGNNTVITVSAAVGTESNIVVYGSGATIAGSSEAEIIEGNGDNATVLGNGGDDFIQWTGQAYNLSGGSGDDYINPWGNGGAIDAGNGIDIIQLLGSSNIAHGGTGEDDITIYETSGTVSTSNSLFGDDGDDTLLSASGSDRLDGGTGADTMTGGAGDDTFVVDDVNDVVIENANEGTDQVETSLAEYALAANVENLTGTSETAQTLSGNELDNHIIAVAAGSVIYGNAGHDLLEATGANISVAGGDGDDTISSVSMETTRGVFEGDAGNDFIAVAGSGFTANGGEGDDVIEARLVGTNESNIYGAEGADTITLFREWAFAATRIDTGDGDDVLFLADSGLELVEVMTGAGNDTIVTGTQIDQPSASASGEYVMLDAGDGDDAILGTFTRGTVFGGAGSDRINVTAAIETISGGDGNDWLRLDELSQQVTMSGDAGNDTFVFEHLISAVVVDTKLEFKGGTGDDLYFVDSNVIKLIELANEGSDTVSSSKFSIALPQYANIENATLTGASNLNVTGSTGANILTGNAGKNIITGGLGRDVLRGGAGADVFDYNALADSDVAYAARDWIMDFQHNVDDIDLSTLDASTKSAGNSAFKFIGTQAFHNQAGELHCAQFDVAGTANDHTNITGDVTGDGIADFRITLKGLVTLSAGDFVL